MTPPVIFVDDEKHLRQACTQSLDLAGFDVESFASADGVLDRIGRDWPGVIVTDVRMAGTDGLTLMADALDRDPDIPVIIITGHGDVPMAVEAMRAGAYDFIEKPFPPDVLVDAVRRASETRRLVVENRSLHEALDGDSYIERTVVGQSPAIQALRSQITEFAATGADVLIQGETGTGKELVARALHDLSPRADGNFVAINCAALPEALVESELFGHEKGAFTGADRLRVGRFEHASGGTVFLDEIESMPLDLQTRLLRVLEERALVRVGANEEIPIDVRVVAATKADLREASTDGVFREDLYYRLNVLILQLPPLRDRLDDLALLTAHFLGQAARRFNRPDVATQPLSPELLSDFLAHSWPGNVRELKNSVMRIALGQPPQLEHEPTAPPAAEKSAGMQLAEQLGRVEARLLTAALERHGNRMKPVYEELGISRKTLYDKLKRHGITVSDAEDA